MNAAGRLGLFAVAVAVAFGASYGIAAAVVPDSVVTDWTERGSEMPHGDGSTDESQ